MPVASKESELGSVGLWGLKGVLVTRWEMHSTRAVKSFVDGMGAAPDLVVSSRAAGYPSNNNLCLVRSHRALFECVRVLHCG